VSCHGNKLTKSNPGAGSRESDRCACQNRRWFLRCQRGSYHGCCQRVRFRSTYGSIARCPRSSAEPRRCGGRRFSPRRILAARIRPTLGSTCNLCLLFSGHDTRLWPGGKGLAGRKHRLGEPFSQMLRSASAKGGGPVGDPPDRPYTDLTRGHASCAVPARSMESKTSHGFCAQGPCSRARHRREGQLQVEIIYQPQ
jgi:hypothetical protein